MRRILSVLLTVLLLLSLLAGCAKPDPGPRNTETGAAKSTGTAENRETTDSALAETETGADPGAVSPLLYHVEDGKGGELYLFGTIHLGDERVQTALELVRPYLDRCAALGVEFDVVAFEKDTKAQVAAMTPFVYTDGTQAADHMPEALYERASELLKQAGLAPGLLSYYNVAMWAQLVEQAALMTTCDLDFDGGMDRALIRDCYEKKLPVRDVESPELQYGLLASFSDELNLLLMENTLDHLDTYGESTVRLYEAWTRGDEAELLALITGEEQEDEEELTEDQIALLEDYNRKMLDDRNLGMRDVALTWMAEDKPVFFAVGAAHLLGENGLAELLRAEGCTVERITLGK